jgi:two-component system, NtrC family, sensor kinase
MKRRSKAGDKPAKGRARKTATPKRRRVAPQAVAHPGSAAAGQETEIARLTRERDEALAHQHATAEILSSISSSTTDAKPVFDAIVRNLLRLFGASTALVALLRDGMIHVGALDGEAGFERMAERYPLPLDDRSVPGRAMSSKHVIHLAPMIGNPETPLSSVRFARDFGFNSLISAPMLRGDKVIGAIIAARGSSKPFHPKQIELIQSFAAQAVIAIENTRLLNELHQRTDDLTETLEQQTATSEVLSVISSSPGSLEPVFQIVLANATRICGAKFATIFLREGEALRSAAMHGAMPAAWTEQWRSGTIFAPDTKLLAFQAIERRQPVQVADLRATAAYLAGHPKAVHSADIGGIRTMVTVPMLKDDEVAGVIAIFHTEVRPFTDKQIELVQSFAAQAVIAIENTRLLSELRESLEQQTATSEVLRVISSSPGELEPVFRSMLENATRICEANFGLLWLSEGPGFRFVAQHGVPPLLVENREREPFVRPGPGTGLGRVATTKQLVHVADITTEEAYAERDPLRVAYAELGGARTLVAVPMLQENELIGVITIFRQEVRPFTDKQIALVTNFAAQAVIAIENTRLLSELRESLEQQTATAEVLGVINASRGDLQPVFEAMVEKARRLCEADAGHLALPVGDDYRSVAVAAMSLEMEVLIRSVSYAPGRGTAVGRALAECRPVQISDIGTDHEHVGRRAAEKGFIRTILGVPLLREGEAIGAFGLSRQRVEPFSEREIELVRTFADQAVIAIENTRLLNELQQRTDDLTASLENLRTAQDRLVQTEKLASLGQLTAGIAHEIKNPLNFVNNFSSVSVELIDELREALSGAQLDAKLRAEIGEIAEMLQGNLDKVVQHGRRADSIVKNMLLHSREGSGERRPVDINALVEESLNLAYHGARAERPGFNIVLERAFDPAAGQADLFPQEITRVLLNLISNGFYATTKRQAQIDAGGYEPTLTATTKRLGDSVEIRIRDNGTGVPPEVKEKMFNPFFTTKPAGEGTGLGLSISHDIIVKQHGGSIAVDTAPGHFTEFKIVLPRAGASRVKS